MARYKNANEPQLCRRYYVIYRFACLQQPAIGEELRLVTCSRLVFALATQVVSALWSDVCDWWLAKEVVQLCVWLVCHGFCACPPPHDGKEKGRARFLRDSGLARRDLCGRKVWDRQPITMAEIAFSQSSVSKVWKRGFLLCDL